MLTVLLVLIALVALLALLPVATIADVATSKRRRGGFFIAALVLFWPLGSLVYGVFMSTRWWLRAASLVVLAANLFLVWTGHQNAEREAGVGTAPTIEAYEPVRETRRLELVSVLRSYGEPGNDDYVQALALSEDASRLLVSGGRSLRLWDLDAGERLTTFEELPANDILAGWLHGRWLGRGDTVALSPDGSTVAAYQGSVTVRLWLGMPGLLRDLVDGRGTGVVSVWSPEGRTILRAHRSNVSAMVFLGDGRLVTGSYDRTLAIWDVARGERQLTIETPSGWVRSLAVSQDARIALSGSQAPFGTDDYSRALSLWDLSDGTERLALTGHTDAVHAVSLAAAGTLAWSASHDGTLRKWRLPGGEALDTIRGEAWVNVAFSRDGRYALSGRDTVELWDLEAQEVIDAIDLAACSDAAAASLFSNDGARIVIGTRRGALLDFRWKG